MADQDTRLYGMADPANHQAPAENGMRGEAAPDDDTGYHRDVIPPDQPPIAVEEESGVAFAEANGAGASPDRPADAPEPAAATSTTGDTPLLPFTGAWTRDEMWTRTHRHAVLLLGLTPPLSLPLPPQLIPLPTDH